MILQELKDKLNRIGFEEENDIFTYYKNDNKISLLLKYIKENIADFNVEYFNIELHDLSVNNPNDKFLEDLHNFATSIKEFIENSPLHIAKSFYPFQKIEINNIKKEEYDAILRIYHQLTNKVRDLAIKYIEGKGKKDINYVTFSLPYEQRLLVKNVNGEYIHALDIMKRGKYNVKDPKTGEDIFKNVSGSKILLITENIDNLPLQVLKEIKNFSTFESGNRGEPKNTLIEIYDKNNNKFTLYISSGLTGLPKTYYFEDGNFDLEGLLKKLNTDIIHNGKRVFLEEPIEKFKESIYRKFKDEYEIDLLEFKKDDFTIDSDQLFKPFSKLSEEPLMFFTNILNYDKAKPRLEQFLKLSDELEFFMNYKVIIDEEQNINEKTRNKILELSKKFDLGYIEDLMISKNLTLFMLHHFTRGEYNMINTLENITFQYDENTGKVIKQYGLDDKKIGDKIFSYDGLYPEDKKINDRLVLLEKALEEGIDIFVNTSGFGDLPIIQKGKLEMFITDPDIQHLPSNFISFIKDNLPSHLHLVINKIPVC